MSRLVKLIVLIVVIFVAWRYVVPRLQKTSRPGAAAGGADRPCVATAAAASDAWGSGIGRFANPPYDIDAWGSFRNDVDRRISDADAACTDSSESSAKARDAMHDLRSLVSDSDSSIRSGAPPSGDLVQRQGQVDAQLDAARELVKQGK